MAEEIEVGDLVRFGQWRYAVVTRLDDQNCFGRFQNTPAEAREMAKNPFGLDWPAVKTKCEIVEKRAKPKPQATGACVCKTADLWRAGCKCGAIVPYAQRA